MSNSKAVGGLEWVRSEIVASLQPVRAWVDAASDGRGDKSELDAATSALREVRGVVTALELSGPARLTEEIEQLCRSVASKRVANVGEALEGLTLALVQLPAYLDRLQDGQPDDPLVLLPAINDLRLSRGTGPLSEAELLVPTAVMAASGMPSPDVRDALSKVSAKVRPHFHRCLVLWFREETAHEGLTKLGRLFHRLQRYIREGVFHELFLAAEAMVEALRQGTMPSSSGTKALISHLDQVLMPFAQEDNTWPEKEAEALLFDMLSRIARCDSSTYLVSELQKAYGFEDGMGPEGPRPSAPVIEAPASLSDEEREDLMEIGDALGPLAAGESDNARPVLDMAPRLLSLADRLAASGANDAAESLSWCAEELGAMRSKGEPVDERRLEIVTTELLGAVSGIETVGHAVAPEPPDQVPPECTHAGDAGAPIASDAARADVAPEVDFEQPGSGQAPSAPPGPAHEVDPELLDIFFEEAGTQEQAIRDQYGRWQQDGSNEDALLSLRRSFDALEGSARMVGSTPVAEFSGAFELLIARLLDHSVSSSSPGLVACLGDAVTALPELIAAEASGRRIDIGALVERANTLASDQAEPISEDVAVEQAREPAKVIPLPIAATAPQAGAVATVDAAEAAVGEGSQGGARPDEGEESADETEPSREVPGPTGTSHSDPKIQPPQSASADHPVAEETGTGTEKPEQVPRRPDPLQRLAERLDEIMAAQSSLTQQSDQVGSRLGELARAIGDARERLRNSGAPRGEEEATPKPAAGENGYGPPETLHSADQMRLSHSLVEMLDELASLHQRLVNLQRQSDFLLQKQGVAANRLRNALPARRR